jgi:uncharacterized phage infection (PIP) family protein YhgE
MKTHRTIVKRKAVALLFGLLLGGGLLGRLYAKEKSGASAGGRATPTQTGKQIDEERQENIFEFFLSYFNPQRVNYGTLIEQKRRALLNATLRNRTRMFIVLLSLFLFISFFFNWRLIDSENKKLWVAAEMMADIGCENDQLRKAVYQLQVRLKKIVDAQETALWGTSNTRAGINRPTSADPSRDDVGSSDLAFDSNDIDGLKLQRNMLKNKVQSLEEANTELDQNHKKAIEEITRLRAELGKKSSQLKDQLTRIDELEQGLRELKENQAAQKNLLPEQLAKIQQLEQEGEKRESKIAELEQQIRNLTQQKEAAEKNISFLTSKNKNLTTEVNQLREKLNQSSPGRTHG